jgi:hypothetical protein
MHNVPPFYVNFSVLFDAKLLKHPHQAMQNLVKFNF